MGISIRHRRLNNHCMAETVLRNTGATAGLGHTALEVPPRAAWLVALTGLTPVALVAGRRIS